MFALLFLVGFVGLHWKLILTTVVLFATYRYGRQLHEQHLIAQTADARRRADIAARADQQHTEVLRGDGHGTFGAAWHAQRRFNDLSQA
ncbi:hypothetical protein MAUB1S_01515 [Mycolicibacterium aubagnense]